MTEFNRSIMLWLLLLMGNATAFSVNYPKIFGDSWVAAVNHIKEHHEEWQREFCLFGVEGQVAEAVVFPELIRYSVWKDEIEGAAAWGLYVLRGREGADFSIGRFQMKPSFAEEVERAWNLSPLAREYGFSFNLQQNSEARRSRIRRLSTTQGQCRYLSIFILLLRERLPQLRQMPLEQQVRLLATAYNCSFSASWKELQRLQRERHFHTGVLPWRAPARRYCYADVAVSYFLSNDK